MDEHYHNFYSLVLRRAVETMILDFYDIHARMTGQNIEGVSQSSRIMQHFINLLQDGLYKRERSVEYYASRLFISPKYLSECCTAVSGRNASGWIEYYTTQEIARLLSDKRKSLADIAEQMNFSSVSYLSRYVSRNLGCSPREFRRNG